MDNRPDGEKDNYPNIEAIARGTISGQFREWTAVGLEARAILERIQLIESRLKVAEEALEKIAEYADEPSSCKVAEQVLDAWKKTKGE